MYIITVILLLVVATHYHCTRAPLVVKNNGTNRNRDNQADPLSYTEIEVKSTKLKYIKDEKSFFNLSPNTTSTKRGSPRAYNTLKI